MLKKDLTILIPLTPLKQEPKKEKLASYRHTAISLKKLRQHRENIFPKRFNWNAYN